MRLEHLELFSQEVLELARNLLEDLDSFLLELDNVLLDGVDRLGCSLGLVRALGEDVGVVTRATTIPGEDVGGVRRNVGEGVLDPKSQSLVIIRITHERELTLVPMAIRPALSLAGVISATA